MTVAETARSGLNWWCDIEEDKQGLNLVAVIVYNKDFIVSCWLDTGQLFLEGDLS